MLIVFGLLAIVISIVWITWKSSDIDTRDVNTQIAAWFTGIIGTAIVVITIAVSYSSYLDIRAQYDAVINQYKGAVTMYSDYASLDMEKATFTDFKYQGYQENMAKVVMDLRKEIIVYNRVLIQKRIMDGNPVFNWLIIAPDKDMKIINIVE
jgi:hypothetical protein